MVTDPPTNRQDQLQYTVLQIACSVIIEVMALILKLQNICNHLHLAILTGTQLANSQVL